MGTVVTASRFANAILLLAMAYSGTLIYIGTSKNLAFLSISPLIVLIVILAICLKLPERFKIRLILVILSGGFTVFLVESILEFADQTGNRAEVEIDFWEQADLRSAMQYTRDLRFDGVQAYPTTFIGSLGPTGFQLDGADVFPLAGISQVPTALCNDWNELIVYDSDEHGFNNPTGIWDRDQIDIVSVGDSFTHGVCVAPNRNATALIGGVYKNTINLGWIGTGPYTHAAIIKEYVGSLKPRIVLWFFFEGNDLEDLVATPQLHPLLTRYLDDSGFRQNLLSKQPEIDQNLIRFIDESIKDAPDPDIEPLRKELIEEAGRERSMKRHLSDVFRLRNLVTRINNVTGFVGDSFIEAANNDVSKFKLLLRDSRDYVQTWDGDLYIVYLPTWDRYKSNPGSLNKTFVTDVHDRVMSMALELDIPVVDITEAFDAHPDPFSLWLGRMNVHYNEDGYRLVADTVLNAIELPSR
jgi:hypothetical protein